MGHNIISPNEIQQKNQHFELVLVQNNSLSRFENDSYQQLAHDQICNTTSKIDWNEYGSFHK